MKVWEAAEHGKQKESLESKHGGCKSGKNMGKREERDAKEKEASGR